MATGIGELRTWLTILRDAVLARVPADLVLAEGGADDKRLDAYLLRAAALSAAGHWLYGLQLRMMSTVSTHPAAAGTAGADALAPLLRELAAIHATAGALPLPGLAQALSMAVTLALIALFVWLLAWLSGRAAVWREVAAATLGVYLVFVVWRLVSGWLGLKAGAAVLGAPAGPSGLAEAALQLAMMLAVSAVVVVALIAPAIAFGRAARLVAPALGRPFLAGVLAWLGVMACDFALTMSGVQRLLTQALVPPA